jgi:hypothetical protein
MIGRLLSIFNLGEIHKLGMVVNLATQIINVVERDLGQDKDAKSAALNGIADLLKLHRDAINAPSVESPLPPTNS